MRNKTFLIEDDAAAGMESHRHVVDWDSVVTLAIRYKLRLLRQGAGTAGGKNSGSDRPKVQERFPEPIRKPPEFVPEVRSPDSSLEEIRRLVAERREAARG